MSLVLLISQSNGLTFGNIGPAPYTPTARVQIWLPEAQTFAPMTPGLNPTTPYADELRLEQHLEALADPHSTSFDTSHLSTYDGLHLDPPSVIALGELFFDNLF